MPIETVYFVMESDQTPLPSMLQGGISLGDPVSPGWVVSGIVWDPDKRLYQVLASRKGDQEPMIEGEEGVFAVVAYEINAPCVAVYALPERRGF